MFSPLDLYFYFQSRQIQGASTKANVWDATDRWVRKAHHHFSTLVDINIYPRWTKSDNPKSKMMYLCLWALPYNIIQMYILTSHRHNDLPWQLKLQFNNQLNTVDLHTLNSTHTNIPKIKEGHLAAQVCEYSCTKVIIVLQLLCKVFI